MGVRFPGASLPNSTLDNGRVAAGRGGGIGTRTVNRGEPVWIVRSECPLFDPVRITLETERAFDIRLEGSTIAQTLQAVLQVSSPTSSTLMTEAEFYRLLGSVIGPNMSANVQTVEVGASEQEVAKLLGPPKRIVKVGTKTIYLYENLKITFEAGKVVDAQ